MRCLPGREGTGQRERSGDQRVGERGPLAAAGEGEREHAGRVEQVDLDAHREHRVTRQRP